MIGLGLYGLDTVGNAVHTDLVCPMIVPGYHESVCHPVNRAITAELNNLLRGRSHLSTGSPCRDASARLNGPGGVP